MKYGTELEVAVAAVRAASRVCRGVQADLVTAATLEKKDKSPVTVADFAAQAVVCAALKAAFPGVPVVGEEDSKDLRPRDGEDAAAELRAKVAAHAGMSETDTLDAIDHGGFDPAPGIKQDQPGESSGGTYWTLDPIDGTKGFLRGEQYAVALGLIENGRVVLGVLGCPNLDGGLLMTAVRGEGAKRLPLDGEGVDGETVNVSAVAEAARANFCESVESGHSDQDASVKIAAALGITAEPYRIDSQCKYAAVARGDAAIYLRLPTRPGYREKIWDHAAGMLVVEEAGGTVTDVRGQALDFSLGRQLENNRGVIATNGKFHAQVVEAVKANVQVVE
ncbi:MAG: 3'(2'),5'-bisphosphate nucleotidase [Planctomycetota bacterium]